jgi:hypothetical protein
MKIPIYIINNEAIEFNEKIGSEIKDAQPHLINLVFNSLDLQCFWIDDEVNSLTGTRDIYFYVGGVSFATPWTEHTEYVLNKIIIDKIK